MNNPEARGGAAQDPDPPPLLDEHETAAADPEAWNRVDVIVALRAASARQRDAEIDQLALIAAAADVYSWVDNAPDQAAGCDGTPPSALHGERLWRFGADGTPEAAEFLTMEVGPALGLSPESAGILIGDVLDLRHRLPRTWKLTLAGRVRVWVVRKIAQATRRAELDLATAHELDRHIAPFLPGWTPHQAFARVDMLITHFDPERAEARRREALKRRFVTVDPDEAGTARVTGQVDGLGGIALHNTLNDLAEVIARGGHEGHHDELRALALETLADPTRAAHLLNGTLLSHDAEADQPITAAEDVSADDRVKQDEPIASAPQPRIGVLRLDLRLTAADLIAGAGGESPQLGEVVRSHLQALIAAAGKVIIRPILDPAAPLEADTYEIPERIRSSVTALYPRVVFPYSNRSSSGQHVDLDHITTWPDGPTENGNLAPVDRRTHRGKTFGGYSLRVVRRGILQWTTPTGQQYWVTPQGTYDYDPEKAPTPSARLAELARNALRRRQAHRAEQAVRDQLAKETLQPVLIPESAPLRWRGDNRPPTPQAQTTTPEAPPF